MLCYIAVVVNVVVVVVVVVAVVAAVAAVVVVAVVVVGLNDMLISYCYLLLLVCLYEFNY